MNLEKLTFGAVVLGGLLIVAGHGNIDEINKRSSQRIYDVTTGVDEFKEEQTYKKIESIGVLLVSYGVGLRVFDEMYKKRISA